MSSQVTNYQLREAANFAEDLWPDGLGFYIAMDLRQRAQTNSPLFMPDFLDPAVADINRLYSEAKSAGLLSSQNRVPESTS